MDGEPTTRRRFVVTVDDPGGLIQDVPTLQRVVDFLGEVGVPASFFVVPRGKGGWRVDQAHEWLAAAHDAERQGHDCQLHGLDHAGCEFGPFPSFVRAMSGGDPDARLRSDWERDGHLWRREVCGEKLSTAIDLFQNAFGRRPLALRTGALSQAPELYDAVADVGMRYVSNRVVDPRGWAYIAGRYDAPGDWDPCVPPGPYRLTKRVIDLPMISEYAWRLTEEKIEPHLALAREDLQRVYAADGVFLLICHVQEAGAPAPHSRDLLRKLFQATRQDYNVTFLTVSQLIADIESGAVRVRDFDPSAMEGENYNGHRPV